ncbi:MAG: hypothetical protein II707_07210, partial [Spirochaetales bacterium]|nr:hypothetical protein [Spirochaetales bacterium]
ELLVNTKYNGEVLRSVNGTYRKLGTDDLLSLESYKLDESQTASDTLIGIIGFGLNNSFTTWNPDGKQGSHGIYALSGNNITLAFTSGKIKSGSITGTISSDLSSMTLSGSVITEDSETVSVSGTYNKEVWTAKTTSNSIFKYKPVVHHPISDFVGTWNVTGGSYLESNSNYTDWKIVFDAEGYWKESYTVDGNPRSFTDTVESNVGNTLFMDSGLSYFYEINDNTMILNVDIGGLLTNLMMDLEPFYILTKQTN